MKRKPIDLKNPAGRKKFYLSPEWQAIRRIKLVNNPFCEECVKEGVMIPAQDVHHRVDIKDDHTKAMKYDNLQSLCKSCHSTITYNSNAESLKKSRLFDIVNKKWDVEEMRKSMNISVDI